MDYLGLRGRRYIGTPRQPTFAIYQWVDGEYRVTLFRGDDGIASPTLPELSLTLAQIFMGIEELRIQRTNLSQAEFAVHCGIPLRTYQRWIAGTTEAKLTPQQWKALMSVLSIPSVDEIPNDFAGSEGVPL